MSTAIDNYIAGAIGGSTGLLVGHPFDTTKVQLQTQLHENKYKGLADAVTSIHHKGLARGFFRGLASPLLSYGVVNSVFFGVYGNTLKVLESDASKRKSSYTNIYLAGCIGGAAQLIPVIPIDYVKVVLQAQIPHDGSTTVRSSKSMYFKGPLQCASYVYRTSGFRGLYKGSTIMFFRDVPSYGIYCLSYEVLSEFLKAKQWTDSKGFLADLIAGGCAGTLTWFSIMPLDVIKSRYQADFKGEFTGVFDCARKSYMEEGITVFYRGCLVTCLRGFPVNAVTFMVYSQTLQYLQR